MGLGACKFKWLRRLCFLPLWRLYHVRVWNRKIVKYSIELSGGKIKPSVLRKETGVSVLERKLNPERNLATW